jgi:hypothetical protein
MRKTMKTPASGPRGGGVRTHSRIALLIGPFTLGFGFFGAVAFNVLGAVKINGPYYRSIEQGKDVIADVLPPPEYLVESYLNASSSPTPGTRPASPPWWSGARSCGRSRAQADPGLPC